MRPTLSLLFLCLLTGCSAVVADDSESAAVVDVEQATVYPAYGYKDGDRWVIPMRVWVHERRVLSEALITKLAAGLADLNAAELRNFRIRIRDFVGDSASGETVSFRFDHDRENWEYRIERGDGSFPRTDLNGLIEGEIRLPVQAANELLRRQGSRNGWLTCRATSAEHRGAGRIQLIEPHGLSVISDIDDTIKVTEIPAGARVVVRNTFFRDFVAAPGMAEMYRSWSGASFHYVSGGPWQLHAPLSEFRQKAGYPEGTFHMKNIRKNLLSASTWEDLKELVANENATFDLKVAHISEIMRRFPGRKFVLVGDSGEKDPEVYGAIREKFPDQVQEIRIRDVVNDQQKHPSRLAGMTIIEAPTVVKGTSQSGT